MKRKIIYSLLAASLLLPMGFNGCTKEAVMEEACIVTSLSNVKTRAGALFEGNTKIQRLRILVFVPENGGLEKTVLYTENTDEFKNPFSICGLVKGIKDVYVVANETDEMNLGAITNKSQLMEKLATPTITGPLNGAQPFLMTGVATGQDLNTTISITMPLTRVAAKISLQFNKNTDKEVTITKVSLLSNTGKSTLLEGGTPIADQTYWDLTIDAAPAVPFALTDVAAPIMGYDSIFVYENLAGEIDKIHATRLEVEAIYDGIPTVYRVYLNEKVNVPEDTGYTPTPGDPYSSQVDVTDHLYKIKRNHHYVFLGTIVNLGEYTMLEVKVKILPWTVHQYQVPLE